jgi:hypothetical protein
MNFEIFLQAQYPSFFLFPFFDFPIKSRWLNFLKFIRVPALGVLPFLPPLLGMGIGLTARQFCGDFYLFAREILK